MKGKWEETYGSGESLEVLLEATKLTLTEAPTERSSEQVVNLKAPNSRKEVTLDVLTLQDSGVILRGEKPCDKKAKAHLLGIQQAASSRKSSMNVSWPEIEPRKLSHQKGPSACLFTRLVLGDPDHLTVSLEYLYQGCFDIRTPSQSFWIRLLE